MDKLLVTMAATLIASVALSAGKTSATSISAGIIKPSEGTTITAPVTAVAPKEKKIKVNYTAETWAGATDINKGNYDGAVVSQQHVGIAYKLDADKTIQFRQYFDYNLTSGTSKTEWDMAEHTIRFTDNKQLTFGDVVVAGDTRLYVPGSEFQTKFGQYQLRHDATVEQKIGKGTVSYLLSTRGFTYAESSDGKVALRMLPAVGYEYEINKTFSPFILAYGDSRWYNTGKRVAALGPSAGIVSGKPSSVNTDTFLTDMGANVKVNSNVSFSAYLTTDKDLHTSKSYNPFDADNNTYEVDLTVSM